MTKKSKPKDIKLAIVEKFIRMQFSENTLRSSDDGVEETLLPIPNRKVKLYSVDGTAWEAVWESRTSLGFLFLCAISSVGRAPDS